MLSSVEVLLKSASSFGETAGYIGPVLQDPRRMISFEDFLKERFARQLAAHDTHGLCAFIRLDEQHRLSVIDP